MNKYIVSAVLASLSLSAYAGAFQLTSDEIKTGMPLSQAQVFQGFGCEGGNKSPSLRWSDAPQGTKSFAVTAYDPDAPTGSGWWHWTMVNIPVTVNSLASDAGNKAGSKLPAGAVQGRNDYGEVGFGGACPPKGDKPHRYYFKVWALKTDRLPIDGGSSGALVGFMLNANRLATAELVPVYGH
ncbi:kinase inhibitor [Brenneria populi subsp. brevivirga]|uniref:kinase inhibitor n=1 Tax=Brenneria populi TaxID=1505588 RepID=UPI002E191C7D|nr:kinase inhibitor [Brenneria populi subsp. brevivirga]